MAFSSSTCLQHSALPRVRVINNWAFVMVSEWQDTSDCGMHGTSSSKTAAAPATHTRHQLASGVRALKPGFHVYAVCYFCHCTG
jgi:hypothetical protein